VQSAHFHTKRGPAPPRSPQTKAGFELDFPATPRRGPRRRAGHGRTAGSAQSAVRRPSQVRFSNEVEKRRPHRGLPNPILGRDRRVARCAGLNFLTSRAAKNGKGPQNRFFPCSGRFFSPRRPGRARKIGFFFFFFRPDRRPMRARTYWGPRSSARTSSRRCRPSQRGRRRAGGSGSWGDRVKDRRSKP